MAVPKFREPLLRKGIWVAVISEFVSTFLMVYLVVSISYIHTSHVNLNEAAVRMPYNQQMIITAVDAGLVVAGLAFVFGFGFPNGSVYLNPAFTLGMLILCKLTVVRAFFYTIAQILGAIFGAGLLYLCFPTMRENLFPCTLLINIGPFEGAAVEFVGAFILVLFAIGIGAVVERNHYGAATASSSLGLLVAVTIIIAGPYTGASFNPARSFGTAVVFGGKCWSNHWIYWVSPMLAGLLSGGILLVLQIKDDEDNYRLPIAVKSISHDSGGKLSIIAY